MMSATALEMLGEVVAVIRKRGMDPQPFIDIMTSTMFGGRAHKIYGEKIAKKTTRPGSCCRSSSRTCAWRSQRPKKPALQCRRLRWSGIG